MGILHPEMRLWTLAKVIQRVVVRKRGFRRMWDNGGHGEA